MVRILSVFRSLLAYPDGSDAHAGEATNNNNVINDTFTSVLSSCDEIIVDDRSAVPITCRSIQISHSFGTCNLVLLQLLLIISITRLLRFLLKPLKQPKVVSDIIGGIIVGPSVLGRNKSFTAFMFPPNEYYVAKNIGIMGFMYFLFVSGVRLDLKMMKHSGKRELYIALVGILIPFGAVFVVGFSLRKSMSRDLAKLSSIGSLASSLAITTVPVLYPILKELNMLSSEVGRMALSTCVIADAIGLNAIVAFEAVLHGESGYINALWYMGSLGVVATLMVTLVRRAMVWIVQRTPEGKAVEQCYVVGILLGVMVMGFMTDAFGMAIANGPFWLGLVIPDGPPLGSALVDRTETILTDLLLPFSYALIGLYTNFSKMCNCWPVLTPLFNMALTGYFSKLLSILFAALFYEMPFRDGLALTLIMSLRGQVDFIVIVHWLDKRVVRIPAFTLLVLLTTTVTAIVTPLICMFYDPTTPYMVNKRRTIQHTPPNAELPVLLCIHGQSSIKGILELIEFSNPSETSPMDVYALHLVELVGRATPMLIDHDNEDQFLRYTGQDIDAIRTTLRVYRETKGEAFIRFHVFTAVTPKRSMYQDVCEVALDNRLTLIVLTYHKFRGAFSVLDNAPCSVAVLVDKSDIQVQRRGGPERNVVVLFLGGSDAREALVLADRMAGRADVTVTVIRFLPYNNKWEDELEKKMDDSIVTCFWVKNERNKRVTYREVVVRNGADTIAAIQAMNDDSFDLWIAGRKEGVNPLILDGLNDWSDNRELGVVGDFLSSTDFWATGSVLVVHQQILRSQKKRRFFCF